MPDETRRWQTSIWLGPNSDQPVTIFGATLAGLRKAVAAWLQENRPSSFGNTPPNYEYSRRVNYAYSDGTRVPIFPLRSDGEGNPPLEEGWHYVEGATPCAWPHQCENFDEVVQHFVSHALIVEKGPDYKEIPLTESGFPLHLIKLVKRERNIQKVNDFLQQGWHILALEFDEQRDYPDRTVQRTSIFLLGHTEEGAIMDDSEVQ